jgi:cytochrome c oxidase cbb3-type subunit 3
METIVGIELFPVIAFLIFFLFFTGLLIYVWKMNKQHVDDMGKMPLDDNTPIHPTSKQHAS